MRTNCSFDPNGNPRRLPITGPGITFTKLVKRYGRDIPHRAALNELERLNIARQWAEPLS